MRLDGVSYIWVSCQVGFGGIVGHIEGAAGGSEFVDDYYRRAALPLDCSALSGNVPLVDGTDAGSTFTMGGG